MKKPTNQRIRERLPSFYKAWTDKSILSQFIEAFAKNLSEAEKDLFRIMRGHWIDTAEGVDLDKLAAVNNVHRQAGESDMVFRKRVKRAIQEYKGGGTVAALQTALKGLFGPQAQNVEIIEFPPTPISFSVDVTSGDTWKATSLGVEDSAPQVTLSVETKGAEVRDPQITSLEEGQSIGLSGLLKSGEDLSLKGKKAFVSGRDMTAQLKGEKVPNVLRKGSEWQYKEFLHGKLGVFDTGTFDESFFATPLPTVRVRFDWVTNKSSTVEVKIPKSVLEKTGVKDQEVLRTLNAIKAVGVELYVRVESGPGSPRAVVAEFVQKTGPQIVESSPMEVEQKVA